MTVINLELAKHQRAVDFAELESVRQMTKEHERALEYFNERERELVNRLGLNKPDGPEVA